MCYSLIVVSCLHFLANFINKLLYLLIFLVYWNLRLRNRLIFVLYLSSLFAVSRLLLYDLLGKLLRLRILVVELLLLGRNRFLIKVWKIINIRSFSVVLFSITLSKLFKVSKECWNCRAFAISSIKSSKRIEWLLFLLILSSSVFLLTVIIIIIRLCKRLIAHELIK